ncbi:Nramp family divalent metal transporter [Pseudofulvibacter geojedonensis]|uniref:Nramp family divalent metal transporter n=1 Tax=Pseudofulvibacter geojedonensis TaxID=1123758 RepID=A0ABW3I507_9FLAO
MIKKLKSLGPGLLFAGAAIGVSHLVQSTRAGADYGFSLLWALFLINIIKYPFFQFGPRYAQATGNSLLDGYQKLGKGFLIAYFILTLATMFTIQTAVTIVTAGLATTLFGLNLGLETWSIIITLICAVILIIGKFKVLNQLMKVIIITLTISTILAVFFAFNNNTHPIQLTQMLPKEGIGIAFLIAFMGWMPAPLDISIWHSLWETEKRNNISVKSIKLFDFNTGYFTTIILGVAFITLGAIVMYPSGESFSPKGGKFANQLINLYQKSLGSNFTIVIAIAAFTTMFSTTLTTLDASPRALEKTTSLLFSKNNSYKYWMAILIAGTIIILSLLLSEMGLLIKIATVLSFLTAPFYAIANYILITSKHTPNFAQPNWLMKLFSLISIVLLFAFSIWYLTTL